jgi:hypothetical protein
VVNAHRLIARRDEGAKRGGGGEGRGEGADEIDELTEVLTAEDSGVLVEVCVRERVERVNEGGE